MAHGSNEGGVLPAWTVTGASEAVNTPVWPPLHLHVSFELLQSLERHFQRMPVEATELGVVMRGAGWQVAHCYGKPLEQPLSQRSHLHVQREPVQNAFLYGVRLQHCHDALSGGGLGTPKSYPRELPPGVAGKWNGKGSRVATPFGGESSPRFTAALFDCGSGNHLRCTLRFRSRSLRLHRLRRLRRHDCSQGGYPAVFVHDASDRQ